MSLCLCGEPPEPAGKDKERFWPPAWVLAVVGLLTFGWLVYVMHEGEYLRRASRPENDLDVGLIVQGLGRAPRPEDTLAWWVGPWVGQVPFYRPLTSYLFWIEWQGLGEHYALYSLAGAAAHLAGGLLFACLAHALAVRSRLASPPLAALLAGIAFSGMGLSYRFAIANQIYLLWKNQPDAFATAGAMAAVLAYLAALRRGNAAPAAVAWHLAACGFKEAVVPLPAVCAVLEVGWGRDWKGAARRLGPMLAAALLFLLVRSWAIGGIGYTYGSNRSWLMRTALELAGPFSGVVNGNWPPALAAGWGVLLGRLWPRLPGRRRRGLGWALLAGLLLVGWMVIGFVAMEEDDAVGLGRHEPLFLLFSGLILLVVEPINLQIGAGAAIGFLVPLHLGRRHPVILGVGLAWTFSLLLPLVFSPGPSHRYYVVQCGYLLLLACWLADLLPWATGALRHRLARRGPAPAAPS